MKSLIQSQQEFLAKNEQIEKVNDKIRQREQQLKRLIDTKHRYEANNHWTDGLIRPIMNLVKAKFPQLTWDDKELVPMGLGNRVSIFARVKGKDECVAYLVFSPCGVTKGQISYETGENTNRYPTDSIANMNRFNNTIKIVETIEEIYDYVEIQLQGNLVE